MILFLFCGAKLRAAVRSNAEDRAAWGTQGSQSWAEPWQGHCRLGWGSGPRVAALSKISLGDSGLQGGWCTASQQLTALLPVAPWACKLEGSFAWHGCLEQGRKRTVLERR